MPELSHFFPLTVYKAKLGLEKSYQDQLIESIDKDYRESDAGHKTNETAWTGDVRGHEFLHSRPLFETVFREIIKHVEEYCGLLNVSRDVFDFYYTRSWATVTDTEQDIPVHQHKQSHVTAVYYVKYPKDAGELRVEPFSQNVPNEFIPGLLSKQNFDHGIIRPSVYLSPGASISIETDDLLIFPSKTSHGTAKNKSRETRMSITADIVAVLRDAEKKEFFLPPLDKWKKFS